LPSWQVRLPPNRSPRRRATVSLELYANYGRGFHSNDVRGAAISVDPVTLDPADPFDVLVKADGAEIGARFASPFRIERPAP
jgi:hypothetical protein